MSKKSMISIAKAFQKGFTLLETLLVTLVLAGLVLFTVMSVRSSSEQTLVKQTAVELQNLLTAELAYYATKSTTGDYKWATSINTLFSNSYMPSSAQCSSWPSTTSTSCIGNRAAYVVETTNERSKYVSVSITLPDAATAEAVARQLPIAGVNDKKVTAYAPIPASISNQRARRQTTIGGTDASQRGWITSVGDIGQNNRNSPLYAGDWCWGGRGIEPGDY
jgi:prepilin-type N-terminal cleavage/methylation domain-containing protein